ncbi:TPA: hypothetical protein ACIPUI_003125 [Citrobacter freundii]
MFSYKVFMFCFFFHPAVCAGDEITGSPDSRLLAVCLADGAMNEDKNVTAKRLLSRIKSLLLFSPSYLNTVIA